MLSESIRHLAIVRFDLTLLRDLLHLPSTVALRDGEYDFHRQQFRFLIEGAELPEAREGEEIRVVDVLYENAHRGALFKAFVP